MAWHNSGKATFLLIVLVIVLIAVGIGTWFIVQPSVAPDPTARVAALHDAVRMGDAAAVQRLLKGDVDPSARDPDFGATPLHGAAANGHTEIARLLLEAGAEPNARMDETGYTPLYWAVENEHVETVAALLSGGCDPNAPGPQGATALHRATDQGNQVIIELLIDNGADVNARDEHGRTPLLASPRALDKPDVVAALLQAGADPSASDERGVTLAHLTAYWLSTVIPEAPEFAGPLKRTLELLLEAGADINARDASERTPVFVSIVRGGPEVVDYLASRGADLQVRSNQGLSLLHEAARTTQFVAGEDRIPLVAYLLDQGLEVDARDERGMTPLHIAAFWANQPLLRFLIERGAEVDARAKAGGNAVYFACQATDPPASDRLETVQFLIEQEVAVDVVGVDGHTPLHMAAWFGHDDLVTLLVERGLDPAEENDEGKTPADLAAEGGFAALAEQLRARTSMDGAAGDEGGGAEGAGSG